MARIGKEKEFRINFVGFRSVLRNPQISRSAKVLLTDLLFYAGVNGNSFPSKETLKENHGFKNVRQITNLLNELSSHGLVSWEKKGLPPHNVYSFNEKIYSVEDRNQKSVSYKSGNEFPLLIGSVFPPKVVNESNHRIESNNIGEKISSNNVLGLKEKISNPTLGSDSQVGYIAHELHKRLDPGNLKAMGVFLSYAKKVPAHILLQYAAEVEKDSYVKSKPALFTHKVERYLEEHVSL